MELTLSTSKVTSKVLSVQRLFLPHRNISGSSVMSANDDVTESSSPAAVAAKAEGGGEISYLTELEGYTLFVDIVANFALPIIIVLGVCANMAVFCLLRRWPRRDSIHVYLSYLTLFDGLILLSGSGYTWLCLVAEMRHVSETSGWTCRLWQFAFNGLLLYTPNWLLVAMLVDQLTIVRWSLAARDICTRFRAHCHVITIIIGQTAVSIHSLWTYELQPQVGGCRINAKQRDFFATAWPYISAVLCFYLPLAITCILLALFAHTLCCTRTSPASSSSLRPSVIVVRPPPADAADAAAEEAATRDDDASSSSERRPSAVSTVILTPTSRPCGRQLRPVIALGVVFTALLTPGIIVNVAGHVGALWTEHPSWFSVILSCQLASCLAYASAAFIFLVSDASLRHQLLAICLRQQARQRRSGQHNTAYQTPSSNTSPDMEMLEAVAVDTVVLPLAMGRTALPSYVTDV